MGQRLVVRCCPVSLSVGAPTMVLLAMCVELRQGRSLHRDTYNYRHTRHHHEK